jgi:surface antigen
VVSDEFGKPAYDYTGRGSKSFWSNTYTDGSIVFSEAYRNCNNWTSTQAEGLTGLTAKTDYTGPIKPSVPVGVCRIPQHLWCIEQ